MTDNVVKLETVFSDHNINFKSTDSVFDIINKKVLGPNLAKVFLDCEAIGEALYNNFVDESLFGEVSVWESLKNTYIQNACKVMQYQDKRRSSKHQRRT